MIGGAQPKDSIRRPTVQRILAAELSDVGLYASTERYGDLCIHVVMDLRRAFSRSELEHAAMAALEAFPVLNCAYDPGLWRDRWRRLDSPVSEAVHVFEGPTDLEAETSRWARRPIAIRSERPLRLVSLRNGNGARLIVSVSHIAVDGAGAAAVGHVLGSHLYGTHPSLPIDARRGLWSTLDTVRWHHLPALARDVVHAATEPLRTLAAAPRQQPFSLRTTPGAPSWRHLVISTEDLEVVKARCRARGATVNDALIAALARVSAGRAQDSGPVAITYTMNLRRYAVTPSLSAANRSSILTAFVPRRAITDLATTAGAVASITARHRRSLAGPAFLIAPMALGALLPHVFTRQVVRWLHPALVDLPLSRGLLVTNVGRLDEGLAPFGSDLEHVRVIGPSLEGLDCPAIVAYGLRGELHLQLYAAPGLATRALDELETELRQALELPAPKHGLTLPGASDRASQRPMDQPLVAAGRTAGAALRHGP